MKIKFLILALLLGLLSTGVLAAPMHEEPAAKKVRIAPYRKLVIAAHVTVVLYKSADSSDITIRGDEKYTRKIQVLQRDNSIMITTESHADMRSKVTIFVPVSNLEVLNINSNAIIRSNHVLRIPALNITIGGLCDVAIVVDGVVSIRGDVNHDYSTYESTREKVLRMPAPIL